MSIYVWSDTHFGHDSIRKYCSRPDASVGEMDERLIAAWNASVGKSDTIWLLGDFAFSRSGYDLDGLFERLNGHKCLVAGNHDERNTKVLRLPWERVEKLYTLKHEGMRAELCHYPLETWKQSAHGALMLHGHCHGTLKRQIPHRFDVGADVWPEPQILERLWVRASEQAFQPSDHHGDL